jgi:AraC-like DNA-binding protein
MATARGVDRFLGQFKSIGSAYYQESKPSMDLRDVVACLWVRVVHLGGAPSLSPILPDGCADIMVYDDAPPCVAGPDATTRWTPLREGVVIAGIRLRPGTVRSIFGCPADRILNGSALLSDLAAGAGPLHQRLLMTATLGDRYGVLEDWVRTALAKKGAVDHAVVAACRLFVADPQLEIDDISRRFNWNVRTMHRQFRAACGYGPKHFQRIMRIQRAIHVVHATAPARLADAAHAAGYADQAHMSRDFRDITGFSPGQYFASTHPGWGFWMSEGW